MGGKNVLIVGPGFIGWNVLDILIEHGYSVTGLVCRDEHAKGIEISGAKAIKGSLDNKEQITKLTSEHDIIFHTATADHLPSAVAILDGIKQQASKGLDTIYIHTSGTSVLDDSAEGGEKSEKIYHDNKRDEVDSVPDNAPHREIDLAIVQAQKELAANAKIAIMIPPLIYGCGCTLHPLILELTCISQFQAQKTYHTDSDADSICAKAWLCPPCRIR